MVRPGPQPGMTGGPGANGRAPGATARIVLLAGPGDATNIVCHHLERAFGDVTLVQEHAQSRLVLARRRARRLGWATVAGQVAFVGLAMPILRRIGRRRTAAILAAAALDPSPVRGARTVPSVNAEETVALLRTLEPSVVVVHGTRIISARVLRSVDCPVVNLHAGITPRYRGVHGGYWALAEGRAELAGATVHVVDEGIDTGPVLAQATFAATPADSIATYPYLQLACGLPLLEAQVRRILDGTAPPGPTAAVSDDTGSQLRSHPTLWGYARRRISQKVR